MRRYLVVANQTLQAAELREELRKKISAGPCSFFVIVPDTKAAEYDAVAAGGVLPQPGMWWWATHYARPATDEEATTQARRRLSLMLAGLARLGVPVDGDLGSSSPLEAMEKVLADHQFDEIIVATLPAAFRAGSVPACLIRPSAGSGCQSRPSSPVAGHPAGQLLVPRATLGGRCAIRPPGRIALPARTLQAHPCQDHKRDLPLSPASDRRTPPTGLASRDAA